MYVAALRSRSFFLRWITADPSPWGNLTPPNDTWVWRETLGVKHYTINSGKSATETRKELQLQIAQVKHLRGDFYLLLSHSKKKVSQTHKNGVLPRWCMCNEPFPDATRKWAFIIFITLFIADYWDGKKSETNLHLVLYCPLNKPFYLTFCVFWYLWPVVL